MSQSESRYSPSPPRNTERAGSWLGALLIAGLILGSIELYGWQKRQSAVREWLDGCTAQVTNNIGDGYVDYHVRCPEGVRLGLPDSLPERRDPGFAVDRGL